MKRKEKEDMEKEKNGYEKVREERIRENKERMQKLGLLKLSQTLTTTGRKRPSKTLASNPPLHPLRRSSRLENMNAVSYKDTPPVKRLQKGKTSAGTVQEEEGQEFYTPAHVKLLGSCVKPWILYENGRGTYDALKGNTCHQCRQKTLGCHTHCSKCRVFNGQLCGDCLYMRYGENVLEVKENPNWICPVCRGICNCSVCRSKKGWAPTGSLYKKVLKMGFVSVAHYLVLTRQTKAGGQEETAQLISSKGSSTFCVDKDTGSSSSVNAKKKS